MTLQELQKQVLKLPIRDRLNIPMKDFEEAVTSAVAIAANLEIIVKRNMSDFSASPVPAMLS